MKADKSLKEVWKWKEKIYNETKHMTMEERVNKIKANALKTSQEYGLDLKTISK